MSGKRRTDGRRQANPARFLPAVGVYEPFLPSIAIEPASTSAKHRLGGLFPPCRVCFSCPAGNSSLIRDFPLMNTGFYLKIGGRENLELPGMTAGEKTAELLFVQGVKESGQEHS